MIPVNRMPRNSLRDRGYRIVLQSFCGSNDNRGDAYMSLSSHLTELRKKHEILSRRIEEEQRSPGADDLHLVDLKRQKLHLKDEIERIAQQV
ncbi:YdcH family protein [Oceanibium sediminis]|uniref:YdcH family protein n=1 Tax=Oceanibium sediminis TaxID=2026339 RepID=UPI00280AE842|nr:DUF465 domain-containing protein [Oceanibium sediminis]